MPEQIHNPNIIRPEITRMAAGSQLLGILSVLLMLFISLFFFLGSISALPLGLICSNMGILLAHLSKGGDDHFPPQAIAGLCTSIFSLVVYLLLILLGVLSLYVAVQLFGLETVLDPEALQNALNNFLNQQLNSFTAGGGVL